VRSRGETPIGAAHVRSCIDVDVPINAVLAAAGYNFRLLLRWLEVLLRALFRLLFNHPGRSARLNIARSRIFTDDYVLIAIPTEAAAPLRSREAEGTRAACAAAPPLRASLGRDPSAPRGARGAALRSG